MEIARIDDALGQCEQHLSSASAFGTEIEALLARSLLVLIYAEFEKEIHKLINEKCETVEDYSIGQFVQSCVSTVVRSPKVAEMTGLLGRFGRRHQDAFRQKYDDQAMSSYVNIVVNRNQIAHGTKGEVSVTFGDAKKFYKEGHVVLDWFRDALFLDSSGSETW